MVNTEQTVTVETHRITLDITLIRDSDGNPTKWPWETLLELDTRVDEVGVTIEAYELLEQYTTNIL